MPDLEHLTGWKKRAARTGEIVAYTCLAVAGVVGLLWPPGYALDGWAYATTRVSGGMAVAAALIAVYAQVRRYWLLELEVIAFVGLGLTGYGTVILLYVGPQREWVLVTALIGALLAGLGTRSSVLADKVDRRVADKHATRAAQGGTV